MLAVLLFMILCALSCCSVLCQTCTFYFFDFFQKCYIDSFRIIDPACRIRTCNRLSTKLLCFLDCIDSNITGT